MDPSVLGTGSIVLNKAQAALNVAGAGANTVPGYSNGGFVTQNGLGRIDAVGRYLQLNWALPTGSPADFSMVLNYHSNAGVGTEFGYNWSAPYTRSAEIVLGSENVIIANPQGSVAYTAPMTGDNYVGAPNSYNNTLQGSSAAGWIETQADGATFNYDSSGYLRTIRNNAGVRWTVTWDADFNFVQHIDGPFGRRTSLSYDGSNHIRRVQGPDGRITSLTVNGNSDLVRIVTPELCTTSLVYDSDHHLLAWIDPLGFRTSYVYDSTSPASLSASVQPLGQRTSYLSYRPERPTAQFPTVVVYPTNARTTFLVKTAGGGPISILNPVGDRTSYAYTLLGSSGTNTSGYLNRVEDARGNITTISYQSAAVGTTAIFPTAVQNAIATYQYRYNSNNQLAAVIDELGNRSSLVWDSFGNRTAVVDPYNQRTTYVYDSMARLIAVENALGFRATQLYDSQGRLAADINPLGFRTSYAYDTNSQLLRVQDPLGHITTTLHDNVNRLTAQIDPLGNRFSFTYDVDGRLIRTTNPIGAITTQIFDANSRLVAVLDALGLRTSYAYDISSNLIRTMNPLGEINTTLYDLACRSITQIDALGNRTSIAYDASWNQIRTENPLGFITTSVFDLVNRQVASIDPVLNRTSVAYDLANDLIRTTNPLGFSTTAVFGKLLRSVATVDPLLNRATLTYNLANRAIRVQDANQKITTTIYDAAGRTVGLLNANGFCTSRVYDSASRLIAIVDANGHRTSSLYDSSGRQTQLIDALGRRTTFGFDGANCQTLLIDARGLRTSYSYDLADRLTGRHYADGSRVTTVYDNANRRTLLNDWTGTYTWTYDADGRLSTVVNPAGFCLTYAYDAASQRKYLMEPEGGVFTYSFDADGRSNIVLNPQGQRTTWSYDAASRVTGTHYANTTRTSYLYDNADRLLRVANLNSSNTTLSSFSYALDNVGNRKRLVEVTGNRVTWSYDKTYQLTNEQRSGSNSYNITYTYDRVGNRLGLNVGGVPTTNIYDAANELLASNTMSALTTYTFDANGNLLTSVSPSNQVTTNAWDVVNLLTQVALPSGTVDTFTYNADGERVQKTDSTGTTKHVWDGRNILLETDASNIIQAVYTLQPKLYGNLISEWRSGIGSFYLYDGLGSTTQLVSSTGSVTDSYLYDSWGNILLASGTTTNPFLFVGMLGYYNDPDVVDYYIRARYYDPESGRFRSRDPLTNYKIVNVARFSAYGYARNNPCVFWDPSGFYGQWCGFSNRGQPGWLDWGPNGKGTPIDTLDYCCELHDECCHQNGMVGGGCTEDICDCAVWMADGVCAIEHPGEANKGELGRCERAANRIAVFFCLGMSSIEPPIRVLKRLRNRFRVHPIRRGF